MRGDKHPLHQLLTPQAIHYMRCASSKAKLNRSSRLNFILIKLTKIHRIATVTTLQALFPKSIRRGRNKTSLMNLQTSGSTYRCKGHFQVGYPSVYLVYSSILRARICAKSILTTYLPNRGRLLVNACHTCKALV